MATTPLDLWQSLLTEGKQGMREDIIQRVLSDYFPYSELRPVGLGVQSFTADRQSAALGLQAYGVM